MADGWRRPFLFFVIICVRESGYALATGPVLTLDAVSLALATRQLTVLSGAPVSALGRLGTGEWLRVNAHMYGIEPAGLTMPCVEASDRGRP